MLMAKCTFSVSDVSSDVWEYNISISKWRKITCNYSFWFIFFPCICKAERQGQKQTSSILLLYSPNACNSRSWARLKEGTQKSIHIANMVGRDLSIGAITTAPWGGHSQEAWVRSRAESHTVAHWYGAWMSQLSLTARPAINSLSFTLHIQYIRYIWCPLKGIVKYVRKKEN